MKNVMLGVFVLFLAITSFTQAETLLSNLDQARADAKPSPFTSGNGKAVDFTVGGTRPFEVSEVVLRLLLTTQSRPVLRVVEKATAGRLARVPLNHAAGLDVPGSTHALALRPVGESERAGAVDVVFVPENPLLLWPGTAYRLALSTETKQDGMLWLAGGLPERKDGEASHSGQAYGRGNPMSWNSPSEVVNLYEVRGRWSDKTATRPAREIPPTDEYTLVSGIYPHLAMFNTTRPIECGVGAVVNWADRLWAVTYSPGHPLGSTDKLFQIDRDFHIYVHPESVGGTPANRMIHEESGQLLIGPYLIGDDRRVRVIPPRKMPGRLTGTARHLTDPANKVNWREIDADEEERGRVIEVTFNDSDAFGVWFIGSGATDLSAYGAGAVQFDLRVLDYGNNTEGMTFQIDCTFPCSSGDKPLGFIADGVWETVTFPVALLLPPPGAPLTPLKLEKVSTGIVLFPTTQSGDIVFQIDDIRWIAETDALPLQQIDLPVTFDDPLVDYTVIDFGEPVSASTVLGEDPGNAENTVAITTKPTGAPVWAGTTIGNPDFANPIPFNDTDTQMSVRVYSPTAGIPVLLKVENVDNGDLFAEVSVSTTVANEWETLVFDFATPAAGALDPAVEYGKASIFFDFGTEGNDAVYYWDDVQFGAPPPADEPERIGLAWLLDSGAVEQPLLESELPKPRNGARLDLPHPLAADAHHLADLLQRAAALALQLLLRRVRLLLAKPPAPPRQRPRRD